jgi:transcriptional regulator with XRE-family HTH domain
MSNIGNRIKALRQEQGLTQTDLAQKIGMSYIQIGRYETQKSNPSADVLQKLAKALETSTDFLMNGSTDAPKA